MAFNIGDRVQLSQDLPGHGNKPRAGWTGEVTAVYSDAVWVRWDQSTNRSSSVLKQVCAKCGGVDCRQYLHIMQTRVNYPVPQTSPPIPLNAFNIPFKVGDRVELTQDCLEHNSQPTKGLKGTVSCVGGDFIVVTWDRSTPPNRPSGFSLNCARCHGNCITYLKAIDTKPTSAPVKNYLCCCGGHQIGFQDFSNVGHSEWCDAHFSKVKKTG